MFIMAAGLLEYEAKLNTNAVIGAQGNLNTAYLEFSNNPYGEGTGKTPDDTAIVFTYQLTVNTTIFYVLGSVLVFGAVVLLITKKRMGAAE